MNICFFLLFHDYKSEWNACSGKGNGVLSGNVSNSLDPCNNEALRNSWDSAPHLISLDDMRVVLSLCVNMLGKGLCECWSNGDLGYCRAIKPSCFKPCRKKGKGTCRLPGRYHSAFALSCSPQYFSVFSPSFSFLYQMSNCVICGYKFGCRWTCFSVKNWAQLQSFWWLFDWLTILNSLSEFF